MPNPLLTTARPKQVAIWWRTDCHWKSNTNLTNMPPNEKPVGIWHHDWMQSNMIWANTAHAFASFATQFPWTYYPTASRKPNLEDNHIPEAQPIGRTNWKPDFNPNRNVGAQPWNTLDLTSSEAQIQSPNNRRKKQKRILKPTSWKDTCKPRMESSTSKPIKRKRNSFRTNWTLNLGPKFWNWISDFRFKSKLGFPISLHTIRSKCLGPILVYKIGWQYFRKTDDYCNNLLAISSANLF